MYSIFDVNAMYASVEQIFRPDLRGKAVAVASNGDGMIVAANRAALQIGLKKYEPVFKQEHFFSSGRCALFSSNYKLYNECSVRLVSCMKDTGLCSEIKQYSIDECFGSFPSCLTEYTDLLDAARSMRRAVWDQVRLPIGCGIARTFTLTKAASFIGKKVQGYRGICVMMPEFEEEALKKVPVSEVWNIGRATTVLLKRQGIHTAADLRNLSLIDAKSWGGVNLERVVMELRGIEVFNMRSFPQPQNRKEVTSGLSLTNRALTEVDLHQALSQRIAVAAEKLRKLKLSTSLMVLSAANSPYDAEYESYKVTVAFEYATDDTRLLISALSENIHQLYRKGCDYYKVSCRLLGLEFSQFQQADLFAPKQSPKVMQTVDMLNHKFGGHIVTVASQKVDSNARMVRKYLSPSYLTDWSDIPRIKC